MLCWQVLPHLLEEVRSEQLQQLVLPLVIHILGKQDKQVGNHPVCSLCLVTSVSTMERLATVI